QPDLDSFQIPAHQIYRPFNHVIEGDFSSASFLLAAAAITNSKIKVTNLRNNSLQGDQIIVKILEEMGVNIRVNEDFVEVKGTMNGLNPIKVDLKDSPDLIPIITVVSCFASGKSMIHGSKRLAFKESNREIALKRELTKMGAKIKLSKNTIKVEGLKILRGAEVDSHGDHRIAMSCVLAGLRASGTTIVKGIECISKSYPNFIKDILRLGAEVYERKLHW
ncbi:MAG: 3-phosphoshikimate 1-carboxyvinyltransferase, partial [Candidatus Bathyarchaeia archaeon]